MEYGLPLNQWKVLSSKDKNLIIHILIFTIALWDNSSNRSIYNSYEVFLYCIVLHWIKCYTNISSSTCLYI